MGPFKEPLRSSIASWLDAAESRNVAVRSDPIASKGVSA
jgi:hypothetical protein